MVWKQGLSFARNSIFIVISLVLFWFGFCQYPDPNQELHWGTPQIFMCVCIHICTRIFIYMHMYSFTQIIQMCLCMYIYTKPSICIHILYACTYIPIFVKSRRKTALPLKGCPDVTFVIPKSQSLDICLQEFVSNGAAGP